MGELKQQNAASYSDIDCLQRSMAPIACKQPDPIHRFAPGIYIRELTVPAGMLIVGKIHRNAHPLIVMAGHSIIISEFGREEVKAGHISISQPGVKRVVLAIEDTRFITVHHNPSDTEDLEIIEDEHMIPEEFTLALKEAKKRLKENTL